MSHITKLKTTIMEKEYLLRALEDMGYTYKEGSLEIRSMGSVKTEVEIKIPLRMSSDIGFRRGVSGYEIIADWWGVRGINQKEFVARLLQRYAYHATRAKLEAQGFSLVEEASHEGQIHLTLRRIA